MTEAGCMPLFMASSNMMLRALRFWGKDKGEDISGVTAELKELKEAMVCFIKQNVNQITELLHEADNVTTVIAKPKVIPRYLTQAAVPETTLTPGIWVSFLRM